MKNARIDVNDVTYEMLLENAELRRQLERQASLERSQAVHELLVEPAVRLFSRIPANATESLMRRSIAVCLALGVFLGVIAAAW